ARDVGMERARRDREERAGEKTQGIDEAAGDGHGTPLDPGLAPGVSQTPSEIGCTDPGRKPGVNSILSHAADADPARRVPRGTHRCRSGRTLVPRRRCDRRPAVLHPRDALLGPLTWWNVAIGNAIAAYGMGFSLWRQHPKIAETLKLHPLGETEEGE